MNSNRLVLLLLLLASVFIFASQQSVMASSRDDAYLAGKIYDFDKTVTLQGVLVRIVNLQTGEAREDKTDVEGCYKFKNVHAGTYSISVSYDENAYQAAQVAESRRVLKTPQQAGAVKEYQLAEKIEIGKLDKRNVAIAACVALSENNSLTLLESCQVCLNVLPPLAYFIVPATALVVGGIELGKGTEPSSPFQPQ
jgi:hypothetical protein